MALPASFLIAGYQTPRDAAMGGRKLRRLMIGTEGEGNTGKTEFALSAPGPGIAIFVDRNFDGTLDNPNPPAERMKDIGVRVIQAPGFQEVPTGVTTKNDLLAAYRTHWFSFYTEYTKALSIGDARSVILDGDSDTWELQRLAEFGTLTNVPGPPGLAYTGVKAARRIMYRKAWDSGKIFISTNKVKPEYKPVRDDKGDIVLDPVSGKPRQERTGNMERQGFDDYDFLWHFQLRHLYKDHSYNTVLKKTIPGQFGIKILMCKSQPDLKGEELWGSDCNLRSLVQFAYPNIPLSEWGF